PDAPLADARASPSCAVSNDMFVAFGGYIRDPNPHSNERLLVVYNLKTNAWVDRFTYTPIPAGGGSGGSGSGNSGSDDSNSGSGSGSGTNLGGIIGGIAGGCVLLCGIFYAIHRNRKSKETKPGVDASKRVGSFSSNPKPSAHTTTTATIVTASVQQQPSFAHAQPVSNTPVVFTPQPPALRPRPSAAQYRLSIPVNSYYDQQTQQPAHQIPVVSSQATVYQQQPQQCQQHQQQQPQQYKQHQQQQQQQQQYQQQIQYEQAQQYDQREQERQRELEHQRIIQAQLAEELALAHQIEEQMARLHTLRNQRQTSATVSPVLTEHSSQGQHIAVLNPVPLPLEGEDESYVSSPSTATMPGEAKSLQIEQLRMNPLYAQPVEGDEYVDEHTGS
ncbi:hypothetical protein BGZ92_006340, partial [Podila epicladia]